MGTLCSTAIGTPVRLSGLDQSVASDATSELVSAPSLKISAQHLSSSTTDYISAGTLVPNGDLALQKSRCQTSHASCWITSSTFYTTARPHSITVASSPNRGYLVPDSTSSPPSVSKPRRACDHGRKRFPIPQSPPRGTPKFCSSVAPEPSLSQERKRVVG